MTNRGLLESATPPGVDATLFFFLTTVVSVALLAIMVVDKYHLWYHLKLWIEYSTTSVPTLDVPMTPAEAEDDGVGGDPVERMDLLDPAGDRTELNCYDPSTGQLLGRAPNMSAGDVERILIKAREAQATWRTTTFAQRRMVLRTIQKYVVQHVEDICRVSARESGKPKVDAVMGEVLTTCEKIRTVCEWGELWLRPDHRPTGPMMMHKTAWVEYVPLGVIVAVAPWNYPFHNSVRAENDVLVFRVSVC
jgi:Aldehyde dehydrogenase family